MARGVTQALGMAGAIIALLWSVTLLAQPVAVAQKPDLGLLIDTSARVWTADDARPRTEALTLWIALLPEGVRAGIWGYAEEVTELVPVGVVDGEWRRRAVAAVADIVPAGERSNLPAAITLASGVNLASGVSFEASANPADTDATTDSATAESVVRTRLTRLIVLSDARLDTSVSPIANVAAARQLLNVTAPALAAQGISVSTVTLSQGEDLAVLQNLAGRTGGVMESAATVAELASTLAGMLDALAPVTQLPVTNAAFVVDSGVRSFSVLTLLDADTGRLALVDPAERRHLAGPANPDFHWLMGESYTLVTVTGPATGQWRLAAPGDALSRVTVDSTLQLEVDPLPASLPVDHGMNMTLRVRDAEGLIDEAEPLASLLLSLAVEGPKTAHFMNNIRATQTGEYQVEVPKFKRGGEYHLLVSLSGQTVQRELPVVVQVLPRDLSIAISTRPMDVPEASLAWPLTTLVAVLVVIAAVALWISRRRRQRKLAVWQRRFDNSVDTSLDNRADNSATDDDG